MELPDKSGASATKKKRIEPVAQAVQVPRPATRRFLDFLFAESPKALGAKIGRDVVVPRIKAGFEEAANSFLSGMLWGDSSNRPLSNMVRGTVLRGGAVNYQAISSGGPSGLAQARQATVSSTTSANYQDLLVPHQQQAELILANMYDLLNEYRQVTVADLYELAGISTEPFHNGHGWTTLDGARISKVRDGFLLELPRPHII